MQAAQFVVSNLSSLPPLPPRPRRTSATAGIWRWRGATQSWARCWTKSRWEYARQYPQIPLGIQGGPAGIPGCMSCLLSRAGSTSVRCSAGSTSVGHSAGKADSRRGKIERTCTGALPLLLVFKLCLRTQECMTQTGSRGGSSRPAAPCHESESWRSPPLLLAPPAAAAAACGRTTCVGSSAP